MSEYSVPTEAEILNHRMNEEFDWSDDKNVVRDAIWNSLMEGDGRDTLKTEAAMEPFMSMKEADIRDYIEKNLKK